MTTVAYIFLDADREALVPLLKQQEQLADYVQEFAMGCREFVIEEKYLCTEPFMERKEARQLLENVQSGDVIVTLHAKWVLGSPAEALQLLALLKEKQVSLYCVDLDGDIVHKTERKLQVNEGISVLVHALCEALAVGVSSRGHAEAIRAGKAKKKKDGKYLGGPVPFGFLLGEDDRLHKDGQQQKVIQEMLRLKADRWSYRNIAQKMSETYGLKFSHEGIRRIVMKQADH